MTTTSEVSIHIDEDEVIAISGKAMEHLGTTWIEMTIGTMDITFFIQEGARLPTAKVFKRISKLLEKIDAKEKEPVTRDVTSEV